MGLNPFSGNDELAALVANLIRVGEVTSVNDQRATARVRFIDRDNVESYDLQVMQRRAGKKKSYSLPDVGEPVICLFLPSGVEQGFILGSYYPATVTPPAASNDLEVLLDEPGGRIEYNRETNTATVDLGAHSVTIAPAALTVVNGGMTAVIDAAGVTVTGGDVVADGISLKQHVHPENDYGGPTGAPQ